MEGSAAAGGALGIGAIAGFCAIAVAAAWTLLSPQVSSENALALLVFGLGLPGLMLQDLWRYVFFCAGRPAQALLNDAAWSVPQLAIFVIFGAGQSLPFYIGVWGTCAGAAALVGTAQVGSRPHLRRGLPWIREHWYLGGALVGGSLFLAAGTQMSTFAIAATSGLIGSASMRGADILFGPLRVITMASVVAGTGEGIRRQRKRPDGDRALVRGITLGLGVVSIGWTLAVMLLPIEAGKALLGDSWLPVRHIAIPYGFWACAAILWTGPAIGLRVRKSTRPMARVASITAPMTVLLALAVSAYAGIRVALFAMAGVTLLGFVRLIIDYRRAPSPT
jgi:hypothetical protein